MIRSTINVLFSICIVALVVTGCGSSNGAGSNNDTVQSTDQATIVQNNDNSVEADSNNDSNKEAGQETKQAGQAEVREPLQVVDGVGNEVTIPAQVSKVYAPGLEDYLVALGVTPVAQWSTGQSPQQYLQGELKDVQQISFANGIPSPESIIDLEPELIMFPTAYYAQNGVYENYNQIAATYVFDNALGDVETAATTIADLLGLDAKEAIQTYHERFEQAKSKLSSTTAGKKAVLINANAKAIFLVGNLYYGGYVLDKLGFEQSKLVAGQASADISLEMLPELDADYIFINDNDGLGDAFLAELKDSPLWNTLPAVKADQIFEVEGDHWRSSGLIAYEKIIDDVEGFLLP